MTNEFNKTDSREYENYMALYNRMCLHYKPFNAPNSQNSWKVHLFDVLNHFLNEIISDPIGAAITLNASLWNQVPWLEHFGNNPQAMILFKKVANHLIQSRLAEAFAPQIEGCADLKSVAKLIEEKYPYIRDKDDILQFIYDLNANIGSQQYIARQRLNVQLSTNPIYYPILQRAQSLYDSKNQPFYGKMPTNQKRQNIIRLSYGGIFLKKRYSAMPNVHSKSSMPSVRSTLSNPLQSILAPLTEQEPIHIDLTHYSRIPKNQSAVRNKQEEPPSSNSSNILFHNIKKGLLSGLQSFKDLVMDRPPSIQDSDGDGDGMKRKDKLNR